MVLDIVILKAETGMLCKLSTTLHDVYPGLQSLTLTAREHNQKCLTEFLLELLTLLYLDDRLISHVLARVT